MKITEITTKILASLMAAAMITGGTAISMSAEEKNEKGTYANSMMCPLSSRQTK